MEESSENEMSSNGGHKNHKQAVSNFSQLTGNMDVNVANLQGVDVISYKDLAATDVEENKNIVLKPPTAQDVAIIM